MNDDRTMYSRHLFWFIVIQIITWTLSSALTRHNLPFDTVEGIAWGQQWAWGYDKHPPLAAWLSALAANLGGTRHWPVYLLSQLSVCLGYGAIWRLANHFLKPAAALIATVLLASIWYYTIATPKFNPNTLMIPIWALFSLCFYRAYQHGRYLDWIGAGILAGLCILTKYESAIILIVAFSLLLVSPYGRRYLCRPQLYLAIVLMLIVWSPNLYWNAKHNWIEIQYALGRAGDYSDVSQGWFSHIYWPYEFLIQQLGTLCLCLLLLLFLVFAPRQRTELPHNRRLFLGFFGLGPLVITLIISAVSGMYLYAKWASAYFNCLPLLVIALLGVEFNARWRKTYYTIAIVCVVLTALLRGLYLQYGPSILHRAEADAYFPGPEIAAHAQAIWKQHSQTPFRNVAGHHYLVANIAVYAPSQPKPYFDWSAQQSPWLNDDTIKQQGSVFAWWAVRSKAIPADIKRRFPCVQYLGVKAFNDASSLQQPVYIGFAYLPAALPTTQKSAEIKP